MILEHNKIKPEGIETLKSEIGLPEGVEPGSVVDKAIKESAQYKMDQQGVKSLLDENYNTRRQHLLQRICLLKIDYQSKEQSYKALT